jgi:hypothetical protein
VPSCRAFRVVGSAEPGFHHVVGGSPAASGATLTPERPPAG